MYRAVFSATRADCQWMMLVYSPLSISQETYSAQWWRSKYRSDHLGRSRSRARGGWPHRHSSTWAERCCRTTEAEASNRSSHSLRVMSELQLCFVNNRLTLTTEQADSEHIGTSGRNKRVLGSGSTQSQGQGHGSTRHDGHSKGAKGWNVTFSPPPDLLAAFLIYRLR